MKHFTQFSSRRDHSVTLYKIKFHHFHSNIKIKHTLTIEVLNGFEENLLYIKKFQGRYEQDVY